MRSNVLRRASGFVAIEVFRFKNFNSLVELTEKKLSDAKAISRFVAGIDFDTVFMRHQIYLMLLAIDGYIENIHTSVRCVHNMYTFFSASRLEKSESILVLM